jgi:hypothetical protein
MAAVSAAPQLGGVMSEIRSAAKASRRRSGCRTPYDGAPVGAESVTGRHRPAHDRGIRPLYASAATEKLEQLDEVFNWVDFYNAQRSEQSRPAVLK